MKLSFRQKLFLPLLASWICLLAISALDIWHTKSTRLEERQHALKLTTETGMSTVKEFAELAAKGVLPVEEAKKQAMDRVRAMRYGADGYFTLVSSQPTVLMHPIKPELEGKDMSGFKDAAGFPIFKAVADIAKGSGEGWINYVWPKPGVADQTKVYAKGSYVLTYKPWDMTFIAGVYIDDLTDAFIEDLMRAAAALAVMLGVLTVIVLTTIRSVERTIGGDPDEAAEVARHIANGDLTENVTTRPNDSTSLMAAIKTMRDNLVGIVARVRGGTEAIASASRQIATGNQDLSARTESQASSLEETAASTEELSSTVKQNAENALEANHLSGAAADVASKGGEVIGRVVTTMGEINDSAQKIVQIIGVIDGIAFQTNILALNAAVEAARAGEQGRGFAVVAQEVRTLAQRSASAAKEIKGLIDASVSRVNAGTALVNQAGVTMKDIVESVQKVKGIIDEISSASHEQTSGIDQIHQAISQLDEVTQQNAALVEEAAAAAEAMHEQATRLNEVVSIFRLGSVYENQDRMEVAALGAPTVTARQEARAAPAVKPAVTPTAQRSRTVKKPVGNADDEWDEF